MDNQPFRSGYSSSRHATNAIFLQRDNLEDFLYVLFVEFLFSLVKNLILTFTQQEVTCKEIQRKMASNPFVSV